MQETSDEAIEKLPATAVPHTVEKEEGGSSGRVSDEESRTGDSFWDFVRFAALAALIVVPIRLFVAQPFIVSGSSMIPSYHDGNYLIIDELSYRFEDPKRGDVIVFRFPPEPSKFLIKRIAGLPGETIHIHNDTITITNKEHPEGFVWQQGAITASGRKAEQTVTLRSDEYFVLGDNRDESADSRLWGNLPRKYITGRPLLRLLPLSELAILPGAWK